MDCTIDIFYTRFSTELPKDLYSNYLKKLPLLLQDKNKRFFFWQDRHRHLFGQMMVLEALMQYGYVPDSLELMQYNKYNRPFLNEEVDFNISHSGAFVVCAIARGIRLGIDIEEIRKVSFDDFRITMTEEQWLDIKSSACPVQSFFRYWSIKESVLKADSRGLSIPLLDIHVNGNLVKLDNHTWYLKELNFDENYASCLAFNQLGCKINIIEKKY